MVTKATVVRLVERTVRMVARKGIEYFILENFKEETNWQAFQNPTTENNRIKFL